MRQRLAFLAGLLFGAALTGLLRRARPRAPKRGQDPRAEELRRKLAESREEAPAPDAEPPRPTTAPAAEAVEASVEEARRRVHERARSAAEEMRRSDGS